MTSTNVSLQNDSISLDLSGQTYSLSMDDAEAMAAQILDLIADQRPPAATPLMEQNPLLSAHNPEIQQSVRDDGKVILAMRFGGLRPFLIIHDGARVAQIVDSDEN